MIETHNQQQNNHGERTEVSRPHRRRQSGPTCRAGWLERPQMDLPGYPHNPWDARFLGAPVDFVVFRGLSDKEQELEEIVFQEVKSGKSSLNPAERRVKAAVEAKRVRYEVYRPDAAPLASTTPLLLTELPEEFDPLPEPLVVPPRRGRPRKSDPLPGSSEPPVGHADDHARQPPEPTGEE